MENLSEILGVFIVIAPILIFLITMLLVRKSLQNHNVNLAELLAEPDALPPTAPAAAGDGGGAPAAPVKRSASRLILFLSGVTSLILSVCITTYYFYMKIYCIDCKGGLALDDFTNVILALGIGVIPYSVNQVKKFKL